jgi:hypothetical protein
MKAARKKSAKSKASPKKAAGKTARLRAPGPAAGGWPMVGEVALFAFPFAPRGWLPCNGQLLSIAQNIALFGLLGTTYGGNGETDFALPKLKPLGPSGPGYCIAVQGGIATR